jgi:sulfite exporter TauE/SafE
VLEVSLLSVFLVGLLGGGHCIGMCGGLVSAMTVTLPRDRPKLRFIAAYNAGRIASYCLAGGIAGALGSASIFLEFAFPVQKVLYGLASVMLILLGLYLAGIWHGVTYIERLGAGVWRKLQPLTKKCLPVQTFRQAFLGGVLWGWLPCGMVYSVLIAAFASANAVGGMLLMLVFGLGTLPTLLAMGMMAVQLKRWMQHKLVRSLSGGLVIAFGVAGLLRVL